MAVEEQAQPADFTATITVPEVTVPDVQLSTAELEATALLPIAIAECPIPSISLENLENIEEAPTAVSIALGEDCDSQSDLMAQQIDSSTASSAQPPVAETLCPPHEFTSVENQPASPVEEHATPTETATSTLPPVAPAAALWQYHPVPSEEKIPDPYPEYACRLLSGEHGIRLIAARVRGKKHKHGGTNCDDWFEIATCGVWNLIAVADGAGSKQFSRIGAKTACEIAVATLRTALGEVRLAPRRWTDTTTVFARDAQDAFVQTDLHLVGDAMRQAVQTAFQKIQEAAAVRRGSERHQYALGGRDIEVNDLATTLLLMVQTSVQDETGNPYDLALSIAIGDGVIGAVSWDGKVSLMMEADHGQFSGETEFLSARAVESVRLNRRLRVFIGRPRRAFLVMSDGVADDYFPNDPGLARLFGDLALNGLIALSSGTGFEIETTSADATPFPVEALAVAGEQLTAEGRQPLMLYAVARYAEYLGVPIQQVIADPALLLRGCRLDSLPGDDAAERLLTWLDAYQVRGSFDDRTLVIAERESLL